MFMVTAKTTTFCNSFEHPYDASYISEAETELVTRYKRLTISL
jgi:hypothetical protein